MIDHCISVLSNKRKQEIFVAYLTNATKNINEILANVYGGNYMSVRYTDIIDDTPQDTRTGEEIKNYMMDKINSIGKGGGDV